MAVIEQPNTPENEVNQATDEKSFADKLLATIDYPTSIKTAIEEAEKKEAAQEEVKPEVPEVKEEVKEEAPEEVTEEKEEDDVVAKSTMQKRIDEVVREKKMLEMRLRRLEEESQQARSPQDDDTAKLEKMTETELQNLKRQVRLSQIQNSTDATMVNKLLDLEDKIETVMKTAPQRFAQNQVSKFNEAVSLSAQEIPNFDKAQKDIITLAKRIYETAPELHSSVSGQARAWNLAVDHYKAVQGVNAGKTKVEELDRQVNTLKKKVSVEGIGRKAGSEPDDSSKLFKKAKNGNFNDKLEFIRKTMRTDEMLDDLRSGRNY